MQHILIIGNLTADAEVKMLEKSKVANFSLAENYSYTKENGEKVEETEFFTCELFMSKESTLDQYLQKGNEVAITGRFKTNSWAGEDGQKKYRTVLKVDNVKLLRSKKQD